VRSEGNMSLKNPVTPPGIDPRTVRLVAQRLNHYATPDPITKLDVQRLKDKKIGSIVQGCLSKYHSDFSTLPQYLLIRRRCTIYICTYKFTKFYTRKALNLTNNVSVLVPVQLARKCLRVFPFNCGPKPQLALRKL